MFYTHISRFVPLFAFFSLNLGPFDPSSFDPMALDPGLFDLMSVYMFYCLCHIYKNTLNFGCL